MGESGSWGHLSVALLLQGEVGGDGWLPLPAKAVA